MTYTIGWLMIIVAIGGTCYYMARSDATETERQMVYLALSLALVAIVAGGLLADLFVRLRGG